MTQCQSRTDSELLEAYCAGDEVSLAELVRRHGPMVLGTCRRVLGESGEAEDAAQAVFMVLSRKARKLRRRSDLAAWLYRSAWYSSTVALRARRRRSAREEEAGAMRFADKGAGYSEADWEAVRPRLDAEIKRLPKSYRQVVVACHLEGRSQAETARELGLSTSTVAGYCRRGLDRLRRRLGVSLSVAALAAMLTEQTAVELSAATFSSMVAAAKGAAPGNVGVIAEGIMKSMFWMKIKVAAVAVIAAVAVGGGGAVALRELGAAEGGNGKRGPVNPTVATMKDNTWIKLPTPKVHPTTRSSAPWMVYAPSLGKAFMWGACAGNSSTSNDLWSFDLAAVKWQQLLKAEPGVKRDPKVLKLKDNVLMTREEKPLGGHQWGSLDYDPDRKVIWHLPLNFPRQGSKNMFHDCGDKLSFTPEDYKKANAALKGPVLWKYDVAKNKWSWVHTQAPKGLFRNGKGTIRYCPPLRKLVMVSDLGDYAERFKLYDPDTNKWSMLGLTVTASAPDVKKPPRYLGYHAPTVYDSKRKQFVIISSKGTLVMDPVKKTLDLAVSAEKTLPACLDGPVGTFVYDSVGETVLGIFVNYTQYNSGKQLKSRGFPADRTNVWALDLAKKKWVLQPKPADGVLPPLNSRTGNIHHFYDPVQSATFFFRGNYNGLNGECWVYRYKRAKK